MESPGGARRVAATSVVRVLALRPSARWADSWNAAWYGFPTEGYAEKVGNLERARETERRDPGTLEITVGLTLDEGASSSRPGAADSLPPDAGTVARALDAWRDRGVGHVQVDLRAMSERTIDVVARAKEKHLGRR